MTEGDVVDRGDLLLEQDPARASARLEKAKAELAAARARLEEAEAGPRAEDIRRARANLAAAVSAVEIARLELEREQALVDRNFASRNRVDVLKGRHEETMARRDEAQAALDELLAGTRSEQIDAARSNLAAARANVDELELTVERTAVRAPVPATVEALPFETGERPEPGQTVVTLIARQGIYARVHVPEPLRTRLASGSAAEIYVDGYDRAWRGRIRWIARQASFTPFFALTQHDRSHLSYLAEIDLIDTETGDLPIGVPVSGLFSGASVR